MFFIEGYFLDHAACTDSQEEESVDRLWLVARSLKNESGKYDLVVTNFNNNLFPFIRYKIDDEVDFVEIDNKEFNLPLVNIFGRKISTIDETNNNKCPVETCNRSIQKIDKFEIDEHMCTYIDQIIL